MTKFYEIKQKIIQVFVGGGANRWYISVCWYCRICLSASTGRCWESRVFSIIPVSGRSWKCTSGISFLKWKKCIIGKWPNHWETGLCGRFCRRMCWRLTCWIFRMFGWKRGLSFSSTICGASFMPRLWWKSIFPRPPHWDRVWCGQAIIYKLRWNVAQASVGDAPGNFLLSKGMFKITRNPTVN